MSGDICKVEFREHGLEVTGPCAKGFLGVFNSLYGESKEKKAEISAYACVNPKDGSVNKIILGKIGTAVSTSLPHARVCPADHRQISIHTHPTSGIAEFSETDALTITDRMNKGVDDGSCVVGEDEAQCLMKALIDTKKRGLAEVLAERT